MRPLEQLALELSTEHGITYGGETLSESTLKIKPWPIPHHASRRRSIRSRPLWLRFALVMLSQAWMHLWHRTRRPHRSPPPSSRWGLAALGTRAPLLSVPWSLLRSRCTEECSILSVGLMRRGLGLSSQQSSESPAVDSRMAVNAACCPGIAAEAHWL